MPKGVSNVIPVFLTQADVAKRLSISREFVRRWLDTMSGTGIIRWERPETRNKRRYVTTRISEARLRVELANLERRTG
jgi:DNA-binding transcriptional regulator LsrR (DeoR family)